MREGRFPVASGCAVEECDAEVCVDVRRDARLDTWTIGLVHTPGRGVTEMMTGEAVHQGGDVLRYMVVERLVHAIVSSH